MQYRVLKCCGYRLSHMNHVFVKIHSIFSVFIKSIKKTLSYLHLYQEHRCSKFFSFNYYYYCLSFSPPKCNENINLFLFACKQMVLSWSFLYLTCLLRLRARYVPLQYLHFLIAMKIRSKNRCRFIYLVMYYYYY